MIVSPLLCRLGPAILASTDRRPRTQDEIRRAQVRNLRCIMRYLAPTALGRHHGLDAVARSADPVAAFRAAVPVQSYADASPWIERVACGEPDVMFRGRAVALAQTSGTTSPQGAAGERWIPQSAALLRHHQIGGRAALSRLLQVAGGRMLGGRMLMLGGSTSLVPNKHGIPTGDLSGITVSQIPRWLQGLYEPGLKLALEADWTLKVQGVAERLHNADVRFISGIPSWLQVLFAEVNRRAGNKRIAATWENLEGFIHGGVVIDPYIPALAEQMDSSTWMMEVYPSSEAFVAVGIRPWKLSEGASPGLELLTDHGTFLEFVPLQSDDPALCADELGMGGTWRVLVTTPGGLLRYEIGDLVAGAGPGRIRFAGRVRTRISVFGEHVEGTALTDALSTASRQSGAIVREYHVAPLLLNDGSGRGHHEWWIEFGGDAPDPAAFAALIDQRLRAMVLDYDAHRQGDLQLLAPTVRKVAPGGFYRCLERRGQLGGQHKVPQARSDRAFADDLASFLA